MAIESAEVCLGKPPASSPIADLDVGLADGRGVELYGRFSSRAMASSLSLPALPIAHVAFMGEATTVVLAPLMQAMPKLLGMCEEPILLFVRSLTCGSYSNYPGAQGVVLPTDVIVARLAVVVHRVCGLRYSFAATTTTATIKGVVTVRLALVHLSLLREKVTASAVVPYLVQTLFDNPRVPGELVYGDVAQVKHGFNTSCDLSGPGGDDSGKFCTILSSSTVQTVLFLAFLQEDATALDFVLTLISIWKLKKRIEKVESTVSDVIKSAPLDVATKISLEGIANKDRSSIRAASKRMVFGREGFRDEIMAKLCKPPSCSDKCYSAIGIYGVSGSGKTIFARYIRDYTEEKCKEDKLFDIIMCIHVSRTFNVDNIFHEMLKDITGNRHSDISDREDLKDKLQKELCDKCFFLILDDFWVEDRANKQLTELLSSLSVGKKGSKILVTAQEEMTARVLCAGKITKMPELDKESFYKMFMHYALDPDGEYEQDGKRERERLGWFIAEKLLKSPIVAVIVAGQLWMNGDDIEFWKNTADHVKFVDTTWDILWWSYQELPLDIRRCLEYCNIFPRGISLTKNQLVRLWMAQGFVKPSATEDMEEKAEGYVKKLISCLFLEPTRMHDYSFTIHDQLHDLLDKVVGSDCFRIDNERIEKEEGPSRIEKEEVWQGYVPREVRHLFVQNYDAELITKMVLGLKNLRTLIIYIVRSDTPVEEMVIESICKRLLKLRVLIIHFSNTIYEDHDKIFRFPKSVGQLKHLRYLGFRSSAWAVFLPSTLNKLHHIQQLDFGCMSIVNPKFTGCLINLLQIICQFCDFANIGRMISLKTLPHFRVRDEEGYEVEQLRYLNKLRGTLMIDGLQNVKSKEQADQANLAVKEQLTELYLVWAHGDGTRCSPKDEAEVLEGLCPPVGLQSLTICCYDGSRYPDWMVGLQNCGPKDLQQLHFWRCNQKAPCLELETFRHLRELWLIYCSWDTLPDNMENLTSLKLLRIFKCLNIRSLPTLPQSLEVFELDGCNEELTAEHANWQKNKDMSRNSIHKTNDWDSAPFNCSYVRFMMTRLFLP
nr:putative disease resistance protein RGA3 [Aegilops tauschii subsp. strangulata]